MRYLGTCQGSQSSSGQLLRYFLATGKPYYRPPETYIPDSQRLQVMVPPGLSPGQVALAYTPGQDCCHLRMDLQCLQGKNNYSVVRMPLQHAHRTCYERQMLTQFCVAAVWSYQRLPCVDQSLTHQKGAHEYSTC